MADASTGTSGTLRVVASEVATDVAGNWSDVAWEFYLIEAITGYSTFNLTGVSAGVTVGGSSVWSGSFTFDWRPAGSQSTLIASGTSRVYHNSDGTGSTTITGSIGSTGTSNAGGPASVSQGLGLTTLILAPVAPSAVAVSRTSDTTHVVTWTRNPATRAPYATQWVQRWDNVSNVWSTVTDALSGAVASFTDTTTVANRSYVYRVVALNGGGSATSTSSSAVQTTPGAPTGAAATKSGANIVVTFTDGHSSGMTVTYEVWRSSAGGAFTLLGAVTSGVGTYTDAAPNPAQLHQYEVRTKSTVGTTLYSGYSLSNTVQLAVPPNAPASLSPNGVAVNAAVAQTLTWLHSSADSSPQSKFQIRHRLVGAGTWTTVAPITSTVSSWTLPAGTYTNGTQFEWQVSTWGIHVTQSPFSATATVTTSTPPTGTISTPGTTLTVSTVVLAWAFYDAEGTAQAEWQAELLDASSALVEQRTATGTATTTTFAKPAADASTYTVRLRVKDGSGLWSAWVSRTFTVAYLPPAAVTLTATYVDGVGAMSLALVAAGAVGGVTVAAASVDVQRRLDGGVWLTVFEGVGPTTTLTDPLPTINGVNDYRAIVYSALPSSVTMPAVSVPTAETRWVFLNGGAAFDRVCRVRANAERAPGVDEELLGFAGATSPSLYSGTMTSDALDVTGIIDAEASPSNDFVELGKLAGPKACRAPNSVRMLGRLSGMRLTLTDPVLVPISFRITEDDSVA